MRAERLVLIAMELHRIDEPHSKNRLGLGQ